MDLATIIGVVVGAGLIIASIADQLSSFMDVPSVFIVIGGGTAATLIASPLKQMMAAPAILKIAVFNTKLSTASLISDLVSYGEIARRDGILALEGVLEQITDPFLSRAIQLAVDGNDPEVIDATLSAEMDAVGERHDKGKKVYELLGKYAPAYGMIGTLVGLILMLANLDDPDAIAPSMAVALLTTLYGAIVANLVALPVADKLEMRNEEELSRMFIVKEGILSIQSGDNPKIVEQKLQVYLSPAERAAAA